MLHTVNLLHCWSPCCLISHIVEDYFQKGPAFKNHSIWFVQLVLATQFIVYIFNLIFLVITITYCFLIQRNLGAMGMVIYTMSKKHPNVEIKLTETGFISWSILLYRLVKEITAPSTDMNIFRTLLGFHFAFFCICIYINFCRFFCI